MKRFYVNVVAWLLLLEVLLFAFVEVIGNINGFAPGVDRPLDQFLPAVAANHLGLVLVYMAYILSGVVLIPLALLFPRLLPDSETPLLRLGATFGVISATLRVLSVSRYLFFVPLLADTYVSGNAATHSAVVFAYQANDAFAGAGLGEYLGDGLFLCLWLGMLAIAFLQAKTLPAWIGWLGGLVALLVATVLVGNFFPQTSLLTPLGLAATLVWFLVLAVVLFIVSARAPRQVFASH